MKSIAFQGERGAYSELASRQLFPGRVKLRPLPHFEDVFKAVESGKVDFGVLPIENSLTGSIHQNFDLLLHRKVWICGETKVRVQHHLIAKKDATLKSVSHVLSHPQALSQCSTFFQKHKHLQPTPQFDTAGSAKFVAESSDRTVAAIAGAQAAEKYNLKILRKGIEDNDENYTRFILIEKPSRKKVARRGLHKPDKTSLVFALKNIPGALYKSLSIFSIRDIDLLKVESRPIHGSPWQYMFYLDFACDFGDEAAQRAVGHLEEITEMLKVLGSYKRS